MVTSLANRFLGSLWVLVGLLIGGVALAYMILFQRVADTVANLLGGNALVLNFITERLGGPTYLNWWGVGLALFLVLMGVRLLALAPVARPVAMAFHLLAGAFILFVALAAFLAVSGAGVVGTLLNGASTTILIILILLSGLLIAAGLGLGTRQATDAFAAAGGPILIPPAVAPPTPDRPVAVTARLINVDSGDVYALRPDMGRIGIGREASQAVILNEPSVSEQHAQIDYRDGQFLLSDIGSRNGTWVNGQRLTILEHTLKANDEIQIGRVRLRFEL